MLRDGKADPVLSSVEDAVELGQKYISQNPQGPFRGNNVHGLETTETQLLVSEHLLETDRETISISVFIYEPEIRNQNKMADVPHLPDVVLGGQRVLSPSQDERHVRQTGQPDAVDEELKHTKANVKSDYTSMRFTLRRFDFLEPLRCLWAWLRSAAEG